MTTATSIAAAIGEPARGRMLYCLLDGRARTSTELAIVAGVNPSTASAHLSRLKAEDLICLFAQGKHRYYSLAGPKVARVLEGLSVLAGASRQTYVPKTPDRLREARTCYDHMAGTLAVLLHDRLLHLRWLTAGTGGRDNSYSLTQSGDRAFRSYGIDVEATRSLRRRFAYPCLDWSERRPHIGGALGAHLLRLAIKSNWITPDLNSRALAITARGRLEMHACFGLVISSEANVLASK